jgi:hypothetical protein
MQVAQMHYVRPDEMVVVSLHRDADGRYDTVITQLDMPRDVPHTRPDLGEPYFRYVNLSEV